MMIAWYITIYAISTIAMLTFVIIYAKKNDDVWGDLVKGIVFSMIPILNTVLIFIISMSIPLAAISNKWDTIKDKKVFGDKNEI